MDKEKKETKQYYVPVHYLDSETSEVTAISIARLHLSDPSSVPGFETRKECMQWFKDRGLADKKFL